MSVFSTLTVMFGHDQKLGIVGDIPTFMFFVRSPLQGNLPFGVRIGDDAYDLLARIAFLHLNKELAHFTVVDAECGWIFPANLLSASALE